MVIRKGYKRTENSLELSAGKVFGDAPVGAISVAQAINLELSVHVEDVRVGEHVLVAIGRLI